MTTTNPHQPRFECSESNQVRSIKITCEAPECSHVEYTATRTTAGPIEPFLRKHFQRDHTSQFEPGHVPSIEVDWEVSADCSVCPDGGDIVLEDSESLHCRGCGSTWDLEGTHGEAGDGGGGRRTAQALPDQA